jgi:enterochelin esterase-like enzyme
MKMRLLFLVSLYFSTCFAQQPTVSAGKIDFIPSFHSTFVSDRSVAVWLPNNYNPAKQYAVLYMHDGKALFDSTIMWNKQEWQVDETMQQLIDSKKIKNTIVVGVWNGDAKRHAEYFPEKPFKSLSKSTQDSLYQLNRDPQTRMFADTIQSDNYLKFLVQELKPYIDKTYSTFVDKENTFVAGASMGGLISLYALCEYPEVFGGAACISTHWPGVFSVTENPIPAAFYAYIDQHLRIFKTHKIYFDYGDQTLDALYAPFQQHVDSLFIHHGKVSKRNYHSQFFRGENHSENSWSKRFNIPIQFLLK